MQDATIPLKYPAGDAVIAKAMTDLATQVNDAIGVTLEPKAVSPNELRDAVERDHNYSLAYYHYDFPDDVYWLGPLLDRRAEGQPAGISWGTRASSARWSRT